MVYYCVNKKYLPMVEVALKAAKIEYQPMNPDELRKGQTDQLEFKVLSCCNDKIVDLLERMPELGIEETTVNEPIGFPIGWAHRVEKL